jgi:eukaryotic-like serine/threonine-protein kinase
VRELIEITLVKNPGMRYRSGGPFADAVAAVRSGRRPPRPNAAPTLGRATPTAVGSAPQSAAMTARAPATAARQVRPATGGHRPPPPPRRTFSSGQRALLWAAGVLGALAIAIAILIVLNAQDKKDHQSPPPTVTDTVTQTTPNGAPPLVRIPGFTDNWSVGNGGEQIGVLEPDTIAPSAPLRAAPSALEQTLE